MKATGIVRRIDDLGRVVIPKEIRRTMRIREGVKVTSPCFGRARLAFNTCSFSASSIGSTSLQLPCEVIVEQFLFKLSNGGVLADVYIFNIHHSCPILHLLGGNVV